jgi:hypothetical protein
MGIRVLGEYVNRIARNSAKRRMQRDNDAGKSVACLERMPIAAYRSKPFDLANGNWGT